MLTPRILTLGAVLAAVSTVAGQVAPGFPVSSDPESLTVWYGTNQVSPPGELLPRPDVLTAPSISTPVFSSTGKAVLFLVDLDVPLNGTRVQLLHWLASNVTVTGNNDTTLVVPSPSEADYIPPSPPVGDIPHAYTFILFSQPEGFSINETFADTNSRIGFNVSEFVSSHGLSQPALAANWISVQNLTGTATTTFPPPRPTNGTSTNTTTSSTATPAPFPGAAPMVLGGGRFVWAGIATGLIAAIAAFAL
ncbi:PEBP-like protein [Lophiostoma macrostomum CBS 122681]|uniref:PEBP-like protein n=1 Tax=Lophiostoma macrostomum CBS 122681 TaxID=1314788 RepID=A0A6A6TFN9_9PLEO|nr:PEBP-like protein [Lophiostoma macrostomum CBS 122681]